MSTSHQFEIKDVNIARVSSVAFFIETQLRAQITSLVDSQAKVTVVASESCLGQEIPGTEYVSIEIPRKINLFKDLIALVKLWLLFKRSKFEIVHSTTPKAGLLSAIAARLARVPIRLHTFTGQPWVELTGLKYFLSKGSDKLIVSLNTHCYADSHTQKDFLLEQGVANEQSLSVLGSGSLAGIDLVRFNPQRFNDLHKQQLKKELGIPIKAKILLFVGRVSRDKGVYELLEAYQKLIKEQPNTYLVLLGPAEISLDVFLEKIPKIISNKIIFAGFSKEPERFMSISDMLVLPSYREGFGTVVIEAGAMGIPTIGSNIYGLSDSIINGETGLLVPVKNIDKLAEAINLLLKDTSFRIRLGNNAKKRVESAFSNVLHNELVTREYARYLKEANQI